MVRIGKCNKCGDCCREETLEERIRVYEAFGVPHKLVNQNCKLFDPATGLCMDYDNRPKDCRDFPMQPLDIIALPKCSYYFVLKNIQPFRIEIK